MYRTLHNKNQFAAAKTIYDDNVNILINFGMPGVTFECQICALKPAPIQILSFTSPGTSGATYYDYIWSDEFTIPCDNYQFYTENVITTKLPVVFSIFAVTADKLILPEEIENPNYEDPLHKMYIDPNTFAMPKLVDAMTSEISEVSTSSRQSKLMPVGKRALKQSLGIPDDAFVLCCLSKIYKLEPDLLQVFAHLLRMFPKTVLMLMGYPIEAQANI